LVVVFLAVGGANRASRDTRRVSEAGQIAAAMESYARNNNGDYISPLPASYLTGIPDVDTGAAPVASAVIATATSGAHYAQGYICNAGGGMTTTGATPRNYAISYWSEQGNGPACKDNK